MSWDPRAPIACYRQIVGQAGAQDLALGLLASFKWLKAFNRELALKANSRY